MSFAILSPRPRSTPSAASICMPPMASSPCPWRCSCGPSPSPSIGHLRVASRQDARASAPCRLMGVTAAFIFAAQMINFPVIGGTSGHLLGAVLAAILLGPWAGTLVMASVIAVQSLLFQDGGLLAMGANIVNMGSHRHHRRLRHLRQPVPACLVARNVAGCLRPPSRPGRRSCWEPPRRRWNWPSAAPARLAVVLPAMLGVHVFIGIGEAFITVGALALIKSARPDLLRLRDARPGSPSRHPGAAASHDPSLTGGWSAWRLPAPSSSCWRRWPPRPRRPGAGGPAMSASPTRARLRPSKCCPATACPGWGTAAPRSSSPACIGVALLFACHVAAGAGLARRSHPSD